MNDSPVDCQNCDRLFRRKANPSPSTIKSIYDKVVYAFCFVKMDLKYIFIILILQLTKFITKYIIDFANFKLT